MNHPETQPLLDGHRVYVLALLPERCLLLLEHGLVAVADGQQCVLSKNSLSAAGILLNTYNMHLKVLCVLLHYSSRLAPPDVLHQNLTSQLNREAELAADGQAAREAEAAAAAGAVPPSLVAAGVAPVSNQHHRHESQAATAAAAALHRASMAPGLGISHGGGKPLQPQGGARGRRGMSNASKISSASKISRSVRQMKTLGQVRLMAGPVVYEWLCRCLASEVFRRRDRRSL